MPIDESGSAPIAAPDPPMPLPYPGETGTSGADGITSGVLGLNCGVGVRSGGGTCAAATATDNNKTVSAQNATGHRNIANFC
jgi:hypothetical protein